MQEMAKRFDSKSKNSKGDFKALFERLEVERKWRAE